MEALWAAIGAAVAGVIGAVAIAYQRIKSTRSTVDRRDSKAQSDLNRRDRKDERDGLWEYITRIKEDHEECQKALRTLNADLIAEKVKSTRAETRIQALEDALTAAKIPFRPYNPDPEGSGLHRVVIDKPAPGEEDVS